MSEISAISGVTAGVAAKTGSSAASVDYDSFLRLLVAEMKNQDPTKPMESTEYVAQLASFSSVEQSIKINEKLDNLLSASFLSGAGSLIGKTITDATGEISGEVKQVKVAGGVGVAVLASGEEVVVDGSVTISG